MKRLSKLSLLLALTLLLNVGSAAAVSTDWLVPQSKTESAPFEDTTNLWCADAVETCYQSGLLLGKTETTFDSSSSLTYAQIFVISARLYDLLSGGDGAVTDATEGEAWYQPAYDLLETLSAQMKAQGQHPSLCNTLPDRWFISQTGACQQDCDRRTFVGLLEMALYSADVTLPAINLQETATPDLTPADESYQFYRAGILNGIDRYGTFSGSGTLTRGQSAAMLARIVDPAQRLVGTQDAFWQCQDILSMEPDTVLLTINGTAFTADDCSEALCQGLRRELNHLYADARQDLSAVLPYAEKTMKLELAQEMVAAKLGITVSEAEVDAGGPFYAGYEGKTEVLLRSEYRQTLLSQKLTAHYQAQYGSELAGSSPGAPSVGEEHLDTDLSALCDTTTAERSTALSTLDLSAAQSRLAAAPGSIGGNYDPYR